ncbi:transcriptional regulator [Pseudacidovorax sp. NFM-22]|uniref:transcriptional regulator n=1 Tax=Pseudacidovorax sp. NFM-22 TaxID=2744469 RepID=UPI001F2CC934|nr:YdaS family helix-turn-helix protein [Pseudacidovorax sp. NFM-22]
MLLDAYLKQRCGLTVAELRAAVGAKSDSQVRQWQHGYRERKPDPKYCVRIERATGGMVRRQDLRPDDWHEIWPELVGRGSAHRSARPPESLGLFDLPVQGAVHG